MKRNEIISEFKKGVKAVKYNKKPNNPTHDHAKAKEKLATQKPLEEGVAEGYWADAVKKAEADREARKGKPFEKNPASHDKDGVYIGDKDLAGNPVPKRTEPGVAEAKADPLGAWIAHKNGTEARKFKTREGAKKYVASHAGFTVSSSEAFHDTYRKKTDKKQGDTMAEDYLDEK